MNISVCMATYNGEKYLPEQMHSIIRQLGEGDEIIVVDDASTDGTVTFLESLKDSRIRIHRNTVNVGHVKSFEKAIGLAYFPVLLMADQDDIWTDGRLDLIKDAICQEKKLLVSSNSEFINNLGQLIEPLHTGLLASDSSRYIKNIFNIFVGKAYYDGCAMGLSRGLLHLILPIPSYVESHDLWIALAANIARSNLHLPVITLRRRIHGNNASVAQRPLIRKIWSRVIFLISIIHLICRRLAQK